MTELRTALDTLDRWFHRRMLDVHTAMPCKVTKYTASEQTVDVVPQVSRYRLDEDGAKVPEELPPLYGVPVAFPRAGGFSVTMPIAVGDFVLVVFSEEPTAAWRDSGQAGEPGFTNRHGLNGAFALPCGFPDAKKLSSAPPTDAIQLSRDGGNGAVVIKNGEVLLGDTSASEFVALANLVKSELDAVKADLDTLKTTLSTHTHPGVTAGPGATGPSADFAGYTPHTPGSVAASKTKAT